MYRNTEFLVTPDFKRDALMTLQSMGITKIIVDFDGANKNTDINIQTVDGLADDNAYRELPLPDDFLSRYRDRLQTDLLVVFIEDWADALLYQADDCWYREDGSFGEVSIKPMSLEINIEMNERVSNIIERSFSLGVEPSNPER